MILHVISVQLPFQIYFIGMKHIHLIISLLAFWLSRNPPESNLTIKQVELIL